MSTDTKCQHGTECLLVLDQTTALRAELAASESLVTALNEHIKCLVEGATRRIAEAREEQREACRVVAMLAGEVLPKEELHAAIAQAPLEATPLGNERAALQEVNARLSAEWCAMQSALAAEVERHQATAKALEETRERTAQRIEGLLTTPLATEDFKEGVRRAALRVRVGPTYSSVDDASLPAGPREV